MTSTQKNNKKMRIRNIIKIILLVTILAGVLMFANVIDKFGRFTQSERLKVVDNLLVLVGLKHLGATQSDIEEESQVAIFYVKKDGSAETGSSDSSEKGDTFPDSSDAKGDGKAQLKEVSVSLEVASDAESIQRGLMDRKSLPKNGGMLFWFGDVQTRTFWMKNTLIPLDLIHINNGEVVEVIPNMQPCKTDPCQKYYSVNPSQCSLEVNAGFAKENNIVPGTRVKLKIEL